MEQNGFPKQFAAAVSGELHVFEYEGSGDGQGTRRYTSQTTSMEAWISWTLCDVPGCRRRLLEHVHCPECGSTEHPASECDMEG